jgi:hypothetical protein
MWQELLHNKCLQSKSLSPQVTAKPTDLSFWKRLMRVKDDFSNGVLLWLAMVLEPDFGRTWLRDKPIADEYPSLYNIVQHKNVTVAHVCKAASLNIGLGEL